MAIGQFGNNPSLSLIPAGSVGPVPAIGSTLVYEDMNASNGGVARATSIGSTFTTIYSKSGSGLVFGFNLSLASITEATWYVRLIVDGSDIFGSAGISMVDAVTDTIYSLQINATNDMVSDFGGMIISNGTNANLRWTGPSGYPVAYNSTVQLQVRKTGTARAFNAGLFIRS